MHDDHFLAVDTISFAEFVRRRGYFMGSVSKEVSRRVGAIVLSLALVLLLVPTTPVRAHAALTQEQLSAHVVPGLDPDNTTINLFDYTTTKTGTSNGMTSDIVGNTGAAIPYTNYQTWLTGDNNINRGRLLLFGDGMRHLGYWNQGLVAGYGEIARENPGMMGIVEPSLSHAGYPVMSNDPETGMSANPEKYSTAWRNTAEMIYANAGPLFTATIGSTKGNANFDPVYGFNIDPVVQANALSVATTGNDLDFSVFPQNNGAAAALTKQTFINDPHAYGVDWSGYDLSEDIRSLQYLFDPDTEAAGKTSYENVTGLFQMNEEGYYSYNMRKNYAEFVSDPVTDSDGDVVSDGHFVLYDQPGGSRTDSNLPGNFFPFNSAAKAFTVDGSGNLVNKMSANNKDNEEPVNHHLGMTLETTFRQPVDGKVGTNDMVFEFAGDDDVWVFVDDVLVLDMGGIHSEIFGTINFATGDVYLGPAFDTEGIPEDPEAEAVVKTNLYEQFDAAGKADSVRWKGSTFASNTSHTLKMFYLERGNYDSSIAVNFNLQPALYQQIYKVDQYGDPLEGAEFDLYAVRPTDGTMPTVNNSSTFTLADVETVGAPLTHLVTDASGVARFEDMSTRANEVVDPFNFSDRYNPDTGDGLLYILRETKAPAGYKSTPQDLLLRFEPQYTMLVVNNRYQTGAYASFVSRVTGNVGSVYYGQIGEDGGLVDRVPGTDSVPVEVQEDGLVVVIPMIRQNIGDATQWLPLYGDNLAGFTAVHYEETRDSAYEDMKRAARNVTLNGALLQAGTVYDSKQNGGHATGWYLTWDDEEHRLTGYLENLPGRADRYLLQNPDGDMRNFYAVIQPEELAEVLGVTRDELHQMTGDERYAALGAKVSEALAADGGERGENFTKIINTINPNPGPIDDRGYCPLDIKAFIRDFRSRIYIPNEQRQLRVMKVDQNGTPRNGAVFALYGSYEDAQANDVSRALSQGETANVAGQEGMLLFEPHEAHASQDDGVVPGYGDMVWPDTRLDGEARSYWLREVTAPAGCEVNPAIVEVKAGVYSIYADAGTEDDGVKVMAGVGKLAQTMVKYASEGDVNITLRDITAIAQHQTSGEFTMDGWQDTPLPSTGDETSLLREMDLHYGLNATIDYGLHDADGGKNYQPFFISDTGYIRTRVEQDCNYHHDADDPYYSTAEQDDLTGQDITGLFSLVNTVVVTDQDPTLPGAGTLVLSKMVSGQDVPAEDYLRNYHFEVRLYDSHGKELTDSYYYYGRDRTGYVKSGDVLPLSHAEELRILGVPEGATYKVVEHEANSDGYYTRPADGTFEGSVVAGGTHTMAFKNIRGVRPPDPELNIVKEQAVNGDQFTTDVLDVEPGDVVTYRLTVSNTSDGPAEGVVVRDQIPEGLEYVEGSASNDGVLDAGQLVWSLGDLAGQASISVTFDVKVPEVDEPTTWTNMGTVTSTDDHGNEGDPDDSNEVIIKTPNAPKPGETPGETPNAPGPGDDSSTGQPTPLPHSEKDLAETGDADYAVLGGLGAIALGALVVARRRLRA